MLCFVPTQAADGNSTHLTNYQYADLQPYSQTFYRLKQVDADGRYSYSNTIQIKNHVGITSIYPNPASGNIHIETGRKITAVQILELTGKTVKKLIPSSNGNYDISSLQPGVYFVEVNSEEGKETFKVLKQ